MAFNFARPVESENPPRVSLLCWSLNPSRENLRDITAAVEDGNDLNVYQQGDPGEATS
jgi:hypothetical protein